LFPYASSYDLRLIAVNLRDYPNSSPLNEREIANLQSHEPEKRAMALLEQAIEIATFIVRLIEKEDIPPPKRIVQGLDHSHNTKEVGGVSLIAWSLSNRYLFSLLANISLLEPHTNALLERYLRIIFIYGEFQCGR
jgi:hypothetical protein